MDELLAQWQQRLRGWIRAVAGRVATPLHAAEDLEQEAFIQIWRCLRKYPGLSDHEFVGMFKACYCRRLASLLGQRRSRVRPERLGLVAEIDLRRGPEHPESWYRVRIEELAALAEAEGLAHWIRKGLQPAGRRSRPQSWVGRLSRAHYETLRELASRCSM